MKDRRLLSIICLLALIHCAPVGQLPPVKTVLRPQRKVLDNGLVLILLERHALPMVTLTLSLKAGSSFDPPGQEGLANLTNSSLTRGTKHRSATQISQQIDFVGGGLSATTSSDFAQLNLTLLKKDVNLGFEILADVLLWPSFTDEELAREKQEIVADLIQQEDEPQRVAARAFYKMVFGSHPYWHPTEGTLKSVPQLTRKQVVGFHRKFYRPNNAVMVVVGDTTFAEINRLLAKYFTDWKPQPVDFPQLAAAPAPSKIQQQLIDKPLTQATILWGHLGVSRQNPDYYAIYVMNYILGGGGFSSRLLTTIRDDLGLVYSVSSYFHSTLQPGSFQVIAQTKNPSVPKVVESILSEIKRINSQPVSDEELNAAKAHITGSFPLKLDTNSKVASYLTYMENYGLGMNYLEKFPDYINAVTKQAVQKVAGKYLHPNHYTLVIVGNQSQINLSP